MKNLIQCLIQILLAELISKEAMIQFLNKVHFLTNDHLMIYLKLTQQMEGVKKEKMKKWEI
jgi:hypothetical protein